MEDDKELTEVVPNDQVLHDLLAGAVAEVRRGVPPPTTRPLGWPQGPGQPSEADGVIAEHCPLLSELTREVRSGAIRDNDFDATVRRQCSCSSCCF